MVCQGTWLLHENLDHKIVDKSQITFQRSLQSWSFARQPFIGGECDIQGLLIGLESKL